jgi:hypothetical protein
MMMSVEQVLAYELAREPKYQDKILPHYLSAHHKSHMTWLGTEHR